MERSARNPILGSSFPQDLLREFTKTSTKEAGLRYITDMLQKATDRKKLSLKVSFFWFSKRFVTTVHTLP
jgi:hypothetical protein